MILGAFVDIGVHQDGLVHISQMRSDRRVEHPLDVVSVGDIVDVRVIEVDANKGRIALSMILDEKEAQNKKISRPAKRPPDKKGPSEKTGRTESERIVKIYALKRVKIVRIMPGLN